MATNGAVGEFDRIAVVTIQGGGIYGLSLLGQLQAVAELGIVPVALAGTSAGAIVAALYWSGLTPEMIRDEFIRLSEQDGGLISLLGPFERHPIRFDFTTLRRLVSRFTQLWGRMYNQFRFPATLQTTGDRTRQSLRFYWNLPLFLLTEAQVVWSDLKQIRHHSSRRGLFPGIAFEYTIDQLLRCSEYVHDNSDILPPKLGEPGGRFLTFGDFRRLLRERNVPLPRLFLTATNLTSRRLELFDSLRDQYSEVPVAKAVRASAAYPLFFRPVDIAARDGDYTYVDGGVISNFPAFVFAQEFRERSTVYQDDWALALRPWVHIGLRLVGSPPPLVASGLEEPEAFFKALYGMLTGEARNELEDRLARFVERSVTVEQSYGDAGGPRHFLEVDQITPRTIQVMFERGKDTAAEELTKLRFALPPREEVEPKLQALLRRSSIVLQIDEEQRKLLRSNVFVQEGRDLVLTYRENMDDPTLNPDRELRFPFLHGLTGFCFVRRRPLLCNLAKFATFFEGRNPLPPAKLFGFTTELQGSIRPDRNWLVSVPIFDPTTISSWEIIDNPEVPVQGQAYAEMDSALDGAVFGVLNLDSGISYDILGLPEDPEEQKKSEKVLALVGIMQYTALEFGKLFAEAYRPAERLSND